MLFTREELLRVMHGFNPWWTGRVPALPKFRRTIYGACRRHLEDRSERFVLLVSGLRGTGKTTMLLQLAVDLVASGVDPRSVLYLSMGHLIFSRVPLPQILQLHRGMVHAKDRPVVLLLDELHYGLDWDRYAKEILSEKFGNHLVATESVQMIERTLVTETQFVRWHSISAPTLSFHEYLAHCGFEPKGEIAEPGLTRSAAVDPAALAQAVGGLRASAAHFRPYLATGGLPWLTSRSEDPGSRTVVQEDAVDNILRRDVALHFGPRNVDDLKRLFVYLCMRSGDVFPVQRYARAVGLSAATVANHLELLERCFLVRRIAPAGKGNMVVQKARYRVVVGDSTLRAAQLVRDEDSLAEPEEMRRALATTVARYVVERYSDSLVQFRYWHDPRTGRDVDLLVRQEGRQTAFQVVSDRSSQIQQNDPLIAYCRRESVARAVLVTAEEHDVGVFRVTGLDTEFVRVPGHVLAYLLGRSECPVPASKTR